jgi:hypothetical protein
MGGAGKGYRSRSPVSACPYIMNRLLKRGHVVSFSYREHAIFIKEPWGIFEG